MLHSAIHSGGENISYYTVRHAWCYPYSFVTYIGDIVPNFLIDLKIDFWACSHYTTSLAGNSENFPASCNCQVFNCAQNYIAWVTFHTWDCGIQAQWSKCYLLVSVVFCGFSQWASHQQIVGCSAFNSSIKPFDLSHLDNLIFPFRHCLT